MTATVPARLTPHRLAWLGGVLLVGASPALFASDLPGRAAGLHALAGRSGPYFDGGLGELGLLGVRLPLVYVSACLLVMAPGLLLTLLCDAAPAASSWLARALLVNVALVSCVANLVSAAIGAPLGGRGFALALLGASALCGLGLRLRLQQGRAPRWPVATTESRALLAGSVGFGLVLSAALAPKFLWESLNGDGTHALESSRLLLSRALPFFPPEVGALSHFPGVNSMLFAFPGSWFLRLFGDHELSARLPILLYVPALAGAVIAFAEQGRKRAVAAGEQLWLWTALLAYTLALAYSASYSPYHADIALPATQDTLLMVCVLAACASAIRAERAWCLAFTLASCLSLPSGFLLLGMFAGGLVLFVRPLPLRVVALIGVGLVGYALIAAVAPKLLVVLGYPPPGGEYAAEGLLSRFGYVQFFDLGRLNYALVPCGIVPLLSFMGVRWHDAVARALMLTTAAYFGMFYVQGYISLHHFVPTMVLPLAVFLRSSALWDGALAPRTLALALGAAVVAVALSLPEDPSIVIRPRQVGAHVVDELAGAGHGGLEALARNELLEHVVPPPWDGHVPTVSYGESSLAIQYYVGRNRAEPVSHLIRAENGPSPAGGRFVAAQDGAALYVMDEGTAQELLRPLTRGPLGAPIYRIPLDRLFRGKRVLHGAPIYGARQLLRSVLGEVGLGGGGS